MIPAVNEIRGLDPVYNPIAQLPRALPLEIQHFGELLRGDWQDEVTGLLRVWQKNCTEALTLRRINHEEVLNTFLNQLEAILKLPGFDIHLDEESFLGSDGRVYGKKFLCLHRHHSQEPYNMRSPMAPQDPRPFMVRVHEPVRALVSWIKRYRPHFTSEQIDNEFRQLPANKQVLHAVPIQIQRVRLEQFERRRQAEEQQQREINVEAEFNAMVDQVVIPQVAAMQENVAEHLVQANIRLDRVEGNFGIDEAALRQRFHQVNAAIHAIDNNLVGLRAELNDVRVQIDEAKQDNIKLQIAIQETEKAIKEREGNWLKDLLTIAVIIAACWAASWAVSSIAKAIGMAAKPMVGTVAGGGIKGGVVFVF